MTIEMTVEELLAPVVANLGVEVVDVEYTGTILRVTVDGAERGEGVTTDTLAQVNRLVSPILDEHDPIAGRYTLEVSSPGVERKLTRPAHFRRALGEQVIIKLNPEIVMPRRLKGELIDIDEDGFVVEAVEIDGVDLPDVERHAVRFDDVNKARTHFDFGPGPKPGKAKKNAAQKQQAKKRQQGSKPPLGGKQQSKSKQKKQHVNDKQGSPGEHSEGDST